MTTTSRAEQLLAIFRDRHPRFLPGVQESRASDPARFDRYCHRFLGWAETAFGASALGPMVDAYVRFTTEVNFAQARYERSGAYDHASYAECEASVYSVEPAMREYLLGVYLTNFLWAHHLDLSAFFEERFLPLLPAGARIRELAPGHGGWGLWALAETPGATLDGFDISRASLGIAPAIRDAAGLSGRATYHLADALQLPEVADASSDACICCFLVEHLETPERLLQNMARILRPGGMAFFTGALTAAQVDHIKEFKRESELVLLAEEQGFRVLDMRSVGPRRTLPKARFLPRSAAFILQKRIQDSW